MRTTIARFGAKIACMGTSHLTDMCSTRFVVPNMSKMIQIRNVPDELHRMLKARAAAEGISLSDLIKRELGATSGLLSFEELDARVKARGRSKVTTAETVRYIREARGD